MVGPYSAPTYHTLGSTTPSGSYLQQVKHYLHPAKNEFVHL